MTRVSFGASRLVWVRRSIRGMSESPSTEDGTIDPIEFLKRALAIRPVDAAKVREDAAKRSAEDEQREREADADY